ncbi:DUF808 domain-containing protein [Nocardioides sp. CFH 31398]|uniref:DUF808 domain-containing protein n=1 Tax=Nocardioides sp. CFH 31398 TaxID=2919579 RepID=UPI001F06B1D6|nr:DUF808 domain-containing protein [Nocardioides sp. CFH 31398]MCH1866446.1 DUF808 domain-containing protein [Nocardioides sp. CFH 31398]
MASGLFALLDDVAALSRMAAASIDDVGAAAGRASVKAAGVVVDDAAVTPQYVQGVAAERELPMIRKIAVGSLRNKLLIILPAALLLSQFLPWLLTPILMLGGAFLCYEGAEKVWHKVRPAGEHHGPATAEVSSVDETPEEAEKRMVSGAIRTDLILSAEIMVISLNEVAAEAFWSRAAILVVVAIGITVLVYGVVAVIVKVDDVGLALTRRPSPAAQRFGRSLVRGMPKVMAVVSVVGTAAMLWVGGHILLVGMGELGFAAPYDAVHHVEVAVHDALGAVGAVAGWLVNTLASAVLGLLVGAVVVAAIAALPEKVRARIGH